MAIFFCERGGEWNADIEGWGGTKKGCFTEAREGGGVFLGKFRTPLYFMIDPSLFIFFIMENGKFD